jgi:hypothetical protein
MLSSEQAAQALSVVNMMRAAVLRAKSNVVGYMYDPDSRASILHNLEVDSQKVELFATDKLDEVMNDELDYVRWYAIMQTIYSDIRSNDSAISPWGVSEVVANAVSDTGDTLAKAAHGVAAAAEAALPTLDLALVAVIAVVIGYLVFVFRRVA